MTPETRLKITLKGLMSSKSWRIYDIGASKFGERGLPDWYCIHNTFGARWLELKFDPIKGYGLSDSQRRMFRDWHPTVGVYVITGLTYPHWEKILLSNPNWMDFLRV